MTLDSVYNLQIELYNTAEYDQKWHLDLALLKELEAETQDYIDETISYQNDEERHDLKTMLTIGAIEEVITALNKSNDLYTAKEILYHLEDYCKSHNG